METTFRKSMSWLHTWSGVYISGLLFAIFWMGTLSVFDREIDRWMMPMTRLPQLQPAPSLDALARPLAERHAPASTQWTFVMPSDRVPVLRVSWRDAANNNVSQMLDPATGQALPEAGTHAGTGFLYPFHYRLHVRFMNLGYWLVGFATMAMLAAIVSGVVVHRKIFSEFFTFRPRKNTQRAALDLHNLTGVLAMPFHFVIGLSGLIILLATYFPTGWQLAYGNDRQAFNAEANDSYARARAKAPGTLASLDAMVARAQAHWGDGEAAQVRVYHPGDANGYVEVRRATDDRVSTDRRTLYFDAASGALLAGSEFKPVKSVQSFVSGLHEIQFRHWTLRWLYFLAGLAGCVMIATGFLVWLEARRARHAKKGLAGVRWVEALAVSSVPGIVVATLVFFVANRLLPLGASWAGGQRADLEMWAFYMAWALTLAHAAWAGRAAWRQQAGAIAALALACVLLNWATTGDHLLLSLSAGQHAVAGMDIALLCTAAVAVWTASKLRWRAQARAGATALVLNDKADYA